MRVSKINFFFSALLAVTAVLLAHPGEATAKSTFLGCNLVAPPNQLKQCLEDAIEQLNETIKNLKQKIVDGERRAEEISARLQSQLAEANRKLDEARAEADKELGKVREELQLKIYELGQKLDESERKRLETERKLHEFLATIAGKAGGAPFFSACGLNGVMIGLKLRTGSLVDSVQAICVQLDDDGSWRMQQRPQSAFGREVPSIYYGAVAGGSGGLEKSLVCPRDEGVVALYGRAGDLIDNLGIKCGRLLRSGQGIGAVVRGATLDSWGGSGGSPFELGCPENMVAVGIMGRSGSYINQVAPMCMNPI